MTHDRKLPVLLGTTCPWCGIFKLLFCFRGFVNVRLLTPEGLHLADTLAVAIPR